MKEDFVELAFARHLLQRADLHAWAVHVDEHVRQTFMLGSIGVRAHHAKAPVGVMAEARPCLLAVDDEMIAVEHGFGSQRREVRTCIRLGIALAPYLIRAENTLKESLLLRFGPVSDERRAEERKPQHVYKRGSRRASHLFDKDRLLHQRCPATAVLFRPGNAYPSGFVHLLLPRSKVLKAVLGIFETRCVPIRGDICLEPGSELITKALLRRREI